MICTPGRPLTPEIKLAIVALKQYFDRNKSQFVNQDSSTQMVSDALGIGLVTVDRVMARYRKDPTGFAYTESSKGHRPISISVSSQKAILSFVRDANSNGKHLTLEQIQNHIEEHHPEDHCHIITLGRVLKRWGFEFGKGKRTQHLKEKDSTILQRKQYLRKMKNNRVQGKSTVTNKPEVYLDESYINRNHSNDFTWYYGEDGPWIQKPTGKGERLIIMDAITKNGWVSGARNVFKSKKRTGDYHGEMNAELFQKWFKENLLPNIPECSIIIMDNAAYHNALSPNSPPTPLSTKLQIRKWLEENGFPCSDDCLKVELVEVLKSVQAKPSFMVDILAEEHGHEVVRTPPYHPELQPIETCWAIVKNDVALHSDFTMRNLESQLNLSFEKVTANNCADIIKGVREIEDNFWKADA